MKRLGVALCLAFTAACVPSATQTTLTTTTTTTETRPDAPIGAVGGVAFDFFANTPLAGAAVTLFTARGPLTATTGADGFYSFPMVPTGSFTVIVTMAGYGSVVLIGTLDSRDPAQAVNNPQTTLNPIGLLKLDQTFAVRVVDENGSPVAGAALSVTVPIQFVEWTTNDNGASPQGRGSFVATATSAADGTATLTGLPPFAKLLALLQNSGQITVNVAPILVMSSAINYSFNGGGFAFDLLDLDNQGMGMGSGMMQGNDDLPTIMLNAPNNELKIEKSSVKYLEGSKGGEANIIGSVGAQVTGPITIQFNNAISSTGLTTTIWEVEEFLPAKAPLTTPATRLKASSVTFTSAVNGNVLTLTPAAAPAAGKSYFATLTVLAAQKPGIKPRTFTVTFPFWGPIGAAVTYSDSQLVRSCTPNNATDFQNVDVMTVLFSEPIGTGTDAMGAVGPVDFICAAFFGGAEFNGATAIATVGEENATTIVCEPGAKRGDIAMTAQPAPVQTGFSREWTLAVSKPAFYAAPCGGAPSNCAAPFAKPSAASRITFKFQQGNNIVHRLNGAIVDDITIPVTALAVSGTAPGNCP